MKIREGSEQDAARLAEVHIRSWQAAYRELIPDDYLDRLDEDLDRRKHVFQDAAQAPPDQGCLFVADVDGEAIGFAWTGPTRDEDAEKGDIGEIWSIYVHPDHWGKGAGKALQDKAMEYLKARGFREATLWVLDTNRRTREWYERQGWEPDGSEKIEEGRGFVLNEARYRKRFS